MTVHADSLFNTVSNRDYLKFKNGKVTDYASVADFLDFKKEDISKITKVAKKSVRYDDRIPIQVKNYLDQIANICQLVAEIFEGDVQKTALWFKTVNPSLGMISPRDMIKIGRYEKLMQFIIDAKEASGAVHEEAA
jgi:hypothetical protein